MPTVAELKHSFHLSFSISQLSFPISPALKPMTNGKWKMKDRKPLQSVSLRHAKLITVHLIPRKEI